MGPIPALAMVRGEISHVVAEVAQRADQDHACVQTASILMKLVTQGVPPFSYMDYKRICS
jgi:hypothetical protein